jgi:hypothetical protein
MSRKTVRHGWAPIALAALCVTTTLARPARATPGDQLWIKGFAGSRQHDDRATAMAISPDGRTVFVTGEQGGLQSSTIAYEARSGALLWTVHHDAMVFTIVAANGRRVFVAGMILDGYDFFTMALDADTGAVDWGRRYHGAAAPSGIALSPDGGSVFVTGTLSLSNGGVKEGTVAYSTRDGATLWSARWDGISPNDLSAGIVAADTRVFVSATSAKGTRGNDYTTIAYDAATGTQLWTRLYDGAGDWDVATGVALGPRGASVFVTGESWEGDDGDYVTVGYDAEDGSHLWTSRYAGPRLDGYDGPVAITASPDRTEMFVTGRSAAVDGIGWSDYATVALDTVTGTRLWASRYGGPAGQLDAALAIVASDTDVFVTGTSASARQYSCDDGPGGLCNDRDVLTVAYDAETGTESWVKRHNGSTDRDDWGSAIVLGPDGQRVFVAGEEVTTTPRTAFPRWITIAYDAS